MEQSTIIGIVASVLTASSLIPQLVKLIKERKPHHVSNVMLFVLCAGQTFWIYYGILKSDPIIIASNVFALLVDTITLLLTFKFKSKKYI